MLTMWLLWCGGVWLALGLDYFLGRLRSRCHEVALFLDSVGLGKRRRNGDLVVFVIFVQLLSASRDTSSAWTPWWERSCRKLDMFSLAGESGKCIGADVLSGSSTLQTGLFACLPSSSHPVARLGAASPAGRSCSCSTYAGEGCWRARWSSDVILLAAIIWHC